jgi:hypothetical protein
VQFSARLAERMVLHGRRSMLRAAPAGGKGWRPGEAFEAQELLLPPADSARAQRHGAWIETERSPKGVLLSKDASRGR